MSEHALDEVSLIEDTNAAWDMIRNRSQSARYAVFVTEAGVRSCMIGGDRHKRFLMQYAHGEVGTYNRFVEYQMLLDDVFHVAREKGLIA